MYSVDRFITHCSENWTSLGPCSLLSNLVILPAVRQDSGTGVGLDAIATSFYQILYNIRVSTIKIDSIRFKSYNHFPLSILADVNI